MAVLGSTVLTIAFIDVLPGVDSVMVSAIPYLGACHKDPSILQPFCITNVTAIGKVVEFLIDPRNKFSIFYSKGKNRRIQPDHQGRQQQTHHW